MRVINESLQERIKREKASDRNTCVFFIAVLLVMLFIFFINSSVYINIEVVGSSMNPTLYSNDYVVANTYKTSPNYGDVVIVAPQNRSVLQNRWIIKRVIAKGGDTLRITGGKVYLKKAGSEDFSLLNEGYIKGITKVEGEDDFIVTVTKGYYFVMGDNRENSSDSRVFGEFSKSELIGVVENWAIKTKGIRKIIIKVIGKNNQSATGG